MNITLKIKHLNETRKINQLIIENAYKAAKDIEEKFRNEKTALINRFNVYKRSVQGKSEVIKKFRIQDREKELQKQLHDLESKKALKIKELLSKSKLKGKAAILLHKVITHPKEVAKAVAKTTGKTISKHSFPLAMGALIASPLILAALEDKLSKKKKKK